MGGEYTASYDGNVKFETIYGVDFSGAAQAGRNIWIAEARPVSGKRLRLVDLACLETKCGSSEREPALKHLVRCIAESRAAVWGIDMPFGLPIELFDDGSRWPDQLEIMRRWQGSAHELGLWCCQRANRLGGKMHLRRTTDVDAKTPFDGYHYRIIYQTFHGMRDVIGPLLRTRGTAILPFHYPRLSRAKRVVLEGCPASSLKRWGIPHQNYKQPTGGALTSIRRRTRITILESLSRHIDLDARHRGVMMRNPGGDALDAVIAAIGAFQSFNSVDHAAIARHERFPREGYLYV